MKTPVSKHHPKTCAAIFQHPIAHDLHRHEVTAMLSGLGSVALDARQLTEDQWLAKARGFYEERTLSSREK